VGVRDITRHGGQTGFDSRYAILWPLHRFEGLSCSILGSLGGKLSLAYDRRLMGWEGGNGDGGDMMAE